MQARRSRKKVMLIALRASLYTSGMTLTALLACGFIDSLLLSARGFLGHGLLGFVPPLTLIDLVAVIGVLVACLVVVPVWCVRRAPASLAIDEERLSLRTSGEELAIDWSEVTRIENRVDGTLRISTVVGQPMELLTAAYPDESEREILSSLERFVPKATS